MQKHSVLFALLLFVGAALVTPAIHTLGLHSCETAHHESGAHDHDSTPDKKSDHDPDACPVCALAGKPCVATSVNVCPVECHSITTFLVVFSDSYRSAHLCADHRGRAPPVA